MLEKFQANTPLLYMILIYLLFSYLEGNSLSGLRKSNCECVFAQNMACLYITHKSHSQLNALLSPYIRYGNWQGNGFQSMSG